MSSLVDGGCAAVCLVSCLRFYRCRAPALAEAGRASIGTRAARIEQPAAPWTNRRRALRRNARARLDGILVPLDRAASHLSSLRVRSSQACGGPQGAEEYPSIAGQSLLARRCG